MTFTPHPCGRTGDATRPRILPVNHPARPRKLAAPLAQPWKSHLPAVPPRPSYLASAICVRVLSVLSSFPRRLPILGIACTILTSRLASMPHSFLSIASVPAIVCAES
ncbi:hypothetical protein BD309DRAFT_994420 [Dichomitus squalens]|nr:hypothetical protein BD309DRAFT_994420 [Dichomitus squalens]